MTIQQRKSHLLEVGKFLKQFSVEGIKKDPAVQKNDPYFDQLNEQIEMAVHHNGWFTRENVLFALEEWSKALTKDNLNKWLRPYDLQEEKLQTVGIIMAGNIP